MRRTTGALAVAAGFLSIAPAHAALINFSSALTGSQALPAFSSTGTGFSTVVLNDVAAHRELAIYPSPSATPSRCAKRSGSMARRSSSGCHKGLSV